MGWAKRKTRKREGEGQPGKLNWAPNKKIKKENFGEQKERIRKGIRPTGIFSLDQENMKDLTKMVGRGLGKLGPHSFEFNSNGF